MSHFGGSLAVFLVISHLLQAILGLFASIPVSRRANVVSIPNHCPIPASLDCLCQRLSFSTREVDITVDDDFLADDDFPEGDDIDTYMRELDQLVQVKLQDFDAVEKSENLFEEVLAQFLATDNPLLLPNVTFYNKMLEILAWNPLPDGAMKASIILERMLDPSVDLAPGPNVDSFVQVMDAWLNRQQATEALEVFKKLKVRFQETKDPDCQPNTMAYNKLLKAHMFCDDDHKQAIDCVLTEMIDLFEQSLQTSKAPVVRPNWKTFVQVIRSRGTLEGCQEIIGIMKELARKHDDSDFLPDIRVYNEMITFLRGQDAEEVLFDILQDADLQPNAVTFRNVILAYQGTRSPAVIDKVNQLLSVQAAVVGDSTVKYSYPAAISTISRAKHSKKATICNDMLKELSNFERIPIQALKGTLYACSTSAVTSDRTRSKEIFQIVVGVLNDLEALHAADAVVYSNVLQCCISFLPGPTAKTDAVVADVFWKACRDGQVSRKVLSTLIKASTSKLRDELIGDGVRNTWSRNVK